MTQSTSFLYRHDGDDALLADRDRMPPAYLPSDAPPALTASQVMRRVSAAAPEARVAVVLEMVKASPYRAVPVIGAGGRLVGMVTEAVLSRLLLRAVTAEERAKVRELAVSEVMETCEWWTVPMTPVTEVSWLFDHTHRDVLPVLGPEFLFYGLIGRGDLVQELSRPFQPPTIGGMATPLGVYLTTGRVSGGAGTLGLMLTGVFMAAISVAALALVLLVDSHVPPLSLPAPFLAVVPEVIRTAVGGVIGSVLGTLPLFLALRFSPIAGYHAAEHQVVHAVERGEPLLVEAVRSMPRVHPRCGTNIVAAVFLATTVFTALSAVPGGLNLLAAGLAALLYWRSLGSWLQQHVTTRPATDGQIESAIFAARQVLTRHSAAPDAPTRPLARLWRMGLPQILLGFAAVVAFTALLAWLFPSLGVILNPILHDLMAN
jgi:predicted transcriptional regulator